MKIKKVVIPAAGFGTRFLPQTKAMPKEMLPVVDKPVIQYVVEEAVAAGIENVIIVTGANKRAIEDHFDIPSEDLTKNLLQGNKENLLQEAQKIADMANFIYVRQKGPYGNGTPVLDCAPIIENEPFVVLWGDEFVYSDPPRVTQMIKAYEKYGGVITCGIRFEDKNYLKRFGVADIETIEGENNVFKVKNIIEKPEPDEAPSNLAIIGGYILPPEIFDALRQLKPGKGGELWLVDAINILQTQGIPTYAVEIKNSKYYDTGVKLNYMQTIVDLGLQHPDIKDSFKDYLKKLNL